MDPTPENVEESRGVVDVVEAVREPSEYPRHGEVTPADVFHVAKVGDAQKLKRVVVAEKRRGGG